MSQNKSGRNLAQCPKFDDDGNFIAMGYIDPNTAKWTKAEGPNANSAEVTVINNTVLIRHTKRRGTIIAMSTYEFAALGTLASSLTSDLKTV